ncbi:MAG TPA: peptide deformylase [Actinomycetota bacterium]|nr:peptide deformylase [Actinomycetota bacterium]
MAILPIRKFGDPVLRQKAREVEAITDLHRALITNMLETMRDAPGVGLAAPQVGVLERIFVWEVEDAWGAVINPRITARGDETEVDAEGCLSLPGLVYPVERSTAVRLEGLDERGETVAIEAEGLQAVVFQHELDHLDGVLFIDRLPPELKKEALRTLRDAALGLPVAVAPEVTPADSGGAL